jgi:hypothetical protein
VSCPVVLPVQDDLALSPVHNAHRNVSGARKRRLDFSNIEESSPSLALASYASKLDVLAAAASEAAGKPQTPATSGDHSHEALPQRRLTVDGPSHDSQRTPSKRRADLMTYTSPGLCSPHQLLSPGKGKALLSPGGRTGLTSPGMLCADDLHQNGLAMDLQSLDNAQEGVLDLLREQGMSMDDLPGNLSEFGSPFGTPASLLQVSLPSLLASPQHRHNHALLIIPSQTGCGCTRAKVCVYFSTLCVPWYQVPFTQPFWVQGCRGPVPSPLKTPPAASSNTPLDGSLAAVALRPSAHAALQGLSVDRVAHGFECAMSQPPNPRSLRRSHPRKSHAERLPIGLMQHRNWLMRGCEGATRAGHSGACTPTGDSDLPMSDTERALRHCLNLRTRRWATYEFVMSAIDAPWFRQGTMAEVLQQLGLDGVRFLHESLLSP